MKEEERGELCYNGVAKEIYEMRNTKCKKRKEAQHRKGKKEEQEEKRKKQRRKTKEEKKLFTLRYF